ncbi:MAG: class I SAM-dependent methyltransferase, partial [Pseudobdellovibrionaceae bacterium]
EVYDPFFADDMAAFSKKYSFVTCTEVVEHFNNPAQEFTKLAELLLPQGILGLMTEERPSAVDAFASWYYRRDPSHVSFYSDKTMNWIAQKWELSLVHRGANVWIFRKDD